MLESRVAIVTGGAGMVGSHISRLLASEGASVVISDVNAESGKALAQEIGSGGGRAVFESTDVSTFAGGKSVVQRALDEFGTIDILVTLAGRQGVRLLTEITEDQWNVEISTHLTGQFSVIQAAAPIMMAKRYGRIVTCSSVMGTIGDSHMVPYCAAKAGVIGLTRAAAIELDPYNICVNSICPSGRDGVLGPVGTRSVRSGRGQRAAGCVFGERGGELDHRPCVR